MDILTNIFWVILGVLLAASSLKKIEDAVEHKMGLKFIWNVCILIAVAMMIRGHWPIW